MSAQWSDRIGTRVLYEDDGCRVWLLELGPGERSDWHTHDTEYVYVVTLPGPVKTEYADGTSEDQDDSRGETSRRLPGLAHCLVNLGEHRYQNIIVELKSGGPQEARG